jgi:hypothetical protein
MSSDVLLTKSRINCLLNPSPFRLITKSQIEEFNEIVDGKRRSMTVPTFRMAIIANNATIDHVLVTVNSPSTIAELALIDRMEFLPFQSDFSPFVFHFFSSSF